MKRSNRTKPGMYRAVSDRMCNLCTYCVVCSVHCAPLDAPLALLRFDHMAQIMLNHPTAGAGHQSSAMAAPPKRLIRWPALSAP